MRETGLLFFLFCFSAHFQLFDQTSCEKCIDTDTVFSIITKIELSCAYKKKKTVYDEGMFLDYYFKDGAVITIFKGALHTMPLLSEELGYSPCKTDTIDNRIISVGKKGEKYWREDVLANKVRVYYDFVSCKKKKEFDEMLNSLILIK